MEENRESKKSIISEQIFDILCLAASYGILLLLPEKTGLLFYLIFGGSAFLFCIGFFRFGLSFDTPSDSKGELLFVIVCIVFGVLIHIVGGYIINQEQGSTRSIMVATLLLIEAIVIFTMAGSGFENPKYQRLTPVVFQATAIFLILFAAAYVIWKHFSMASVTISTSLLIEGICLWMMRHDSNSFNSMNSEIQTVPGLRVPISQLQQTFSSVRTQLGYPWIGKVKTIQQDAIIYGPSEDGFVVYGYYLYGRFYVAGSTNPLFPDPEDAQGHIVAEVPDSSGLLLNKEELTEAYVKMFTRYVENGSTQWIIDDPEQSAP